MANSVKSDPVPVPCPAFFYFDLGNVLLDFDHAIACRNVAEITGLAPEVVRQTIFRSGLELRYEGGELTTEEFHLEFESRTGTKVSLDALMLACSDMFTVKPGMAAILAELRAAGHRLGLLSNTNVAHWRFVYPTRYNELWPHFEVFALSFELKSLKPMPRIYEQAAELARVPATSIFFVDDRADNVANAEAVGMDAIRFESAMQVRQELNLRRALG
ncbi:MAG: HAD family hydrolase [Planctomycetota bacterium]